MALIGTVQLMDDLNTSVTKRYEMEATTLAQAAIDMGVLAADLLAVTDLGIVAVTYSIKDTAEASSPAAGSNVDTGATFRLRLDSGKVASHKVPGFPQRKAGGNRAIDPGDADGAAYLGKLDTA